MDRNYLKDSHLELINFLPETGIVDNPVYLKNYLRHKKKQSFKTNTIETNRKNSGNYMRGRWTYLL